MPQPLSHPNEDMLEGYAMSRVAQRETDLVDEHLLCCESCRAALTGLDKEIAVMRLALSLD